MINHNFKKKFGQNFINDKNLLNAICGDAEICEDDSVLEIGAGGGSLTEVLSQHSKNVVSYEIDNELKEHLLGLGLKNTKFIFGDIMNYSLEEIEKDFDKSYKMVANLPYYITTPIIFKFIKSKKLESLTIMVQKEVAERICAKCGGRDYGVLSVMIAFYGEAQIKRTVSRKLFYPQPNVDSAVVNIKLNRNKIEKIDDERFYKFVSGIFSMRRKTLKNNLQKIGIDKTKLEEIGEETLTKRPEVFSLNELMDIYKKIFD